MVSATKLVIIFVVYKFNALFLYYILQKTLQRHILQSKKCHYILVPHFFSTTRDNALSPSSLTLAFLSTPKIMHDFRHNLNNLLVWARFYMLRDIYKTSALQVGCMIECIISCKEFYEI